MKFKVLNAFLKSSLGYSPDRVVADPELNAHFVELCRASGLSNSISDLNRSLLNLRKRGLLKGLRRSIRTSFKDEDSYRYASEIAARHLERREAAALDQIVCDPDLSCEFDTIASNIVPGYSSLQYRWAALNLRKARALRPELLAQVVRPSGISMGRIETIDFGKLPMEQGLYVFYGPSDTLYVGEGECLQRRISKHLDHSDNKSLARWFWSNGFNDVHLEIQTLSGNTSTKVRKALEAELILSRHPLFNVQKIPRGTGH